MKPVWFPSSNNFSPPNPDADFYSAVATAIVHNHSQVIKHDDDDAESLRHMLRAIQLVNERLSGKSALSDTTIAAIVALIRYGRVRYQYAIALIHFTGLMRVLELRGGVTRSTDNPHLAGKIFR
jgi:hypothetical protein